MLQKLVLLSPSLFYRRSRESGSPRSSQGHCLWPKNPHPRILVSPLEHEPSNSACLPVLFPSYLSQRHLSSFLQVLWYVCIPFFSFSMPFHGRFPAGHKITAKARLTTQGIQHKMYVSETRAAPWAGRESQNLWWHWGPPVPNQYTVVWLWRAPESRRPQVAVQVPIGCWSGWRWRGGLTLGNPAL